MYPEERECIGARMEDTQKGKNRAEARARRSLVWSPRRIEPNTGRTQLDYLTRTFPRQQLTVALRTVVRFGGLG